MKLYYTPGTCSLASHIVLAEMNMAYETEAVNLATKVTASGTNFREVNPKGAVPTLKMDSGDILTEGAAILQYLAEQKPEAGLVPKFGTADRYKFLEWLNYTATEIHKGIGALFGVGYLVKTDGAKQELTDGLKAALVPKFKHISEKLGSNDYLMGKQFTVADAYMFTVLNWTGHLGVDITPWKNIQDYIARVGARPAVLRAMKEEGLLK